MSAASPGASDRAIVIAGIGISCIYNLTGWLVPQLTAGIIERFALSPTAAGAIATAEALIGGVLSMLLSARAPPWSLRRVSVIALTGWFLANGLTALAGTWQELVALRLLSGVTAGLMIFTATMFAARTVNPDRTYSHMTVAANVFAAIVIASLPWLRASAGNLEFFPYAAAVSLLWLPLLAFMPGNLRSRASEVEESTTSQPTTARRAVALLVIALAAMQLQSFSNFAFSIPLGVRIGMPEADINVALGTAALVGSVGALAVAFLPRAWGHALPAGLAMLVALISNYATTTTSSAVLFRACLIVNQIALFFSLPLFMGWAALLDPSGRSSALIAGVFVTTAALCPMLAGVLVEWGSFRALTLQTVVMSLLALFVVFLVNGVYRRDARLTTPVTGELD